MQVKLVAKVPVTPSYHGTAEPRSLIHHGSLDSVWIVAPRRARRLARPALHLSTTGSRKRAKPPDQR
jgi:hypothetical protein